MVTQREQQNQPAGHRQLCLLLRHDRASYRFIIKTCSLPENWTCVVVFGELWNCTECSRELWCWQPVQGWITAADHYTSLSRRFRFQDALLCHICSEGLSPTVTYAIKIWSKSGRVLELFETVKCFAKRIHRLECSVLTCVDSVIFPCIVVATWLQCVAFHCEFCSGEHEHPTASDYALCSLKLHALTCYVVTS